MFFLLLIRGPVPACSDVRKELLLTSVARESEGNGSEERVRVT